MSYEIEDFEEDSEPAEEQLDIPLEMPLDGSVSIMELANRQMATLLAEEAKNAAKSNTERSSGMPPLTDLLAGCEIYSASPQATAKIMRQTAHADHPLGALAVGECYTLTLSWFTQSDFAKLRSSVGMYANRNQRRFTILKHKEHNVLEIARIQ